MNTDGIRFLPEPVQLHKPGEVDRLLEDIEAEFPEGIRLIVVDTLARCFVGGDENSAQDMGQFIDGVDKLRKETGAAVVILHHPVKRQRKGGANERGSGALRGAADTMITLAKHQSPLRLTCEKQKDDEEFEPIRMKLVPRLDSCTIESVDPLQGPLVPRISIDDGPRRCLQILANLSLSGATHTEWKKAWMSATGQSKSTFGRYLCELRDSELVENDGEGTGSKYRLTSRARTVVGLSPRSVSDESHGTDGADESQESHTP